MVGMIQVFSPSLGQDELLSIADSFNTGWIGKGPKVTEFECAKGVRMRCIFGHKWVLWYTSAKGRNTLICTYRCERCGSVEEVSCAGDDKDV